MMTAKICAEGPRKDSPGFNDRNPMIPENFFALSRGDDTVDPHRKSSPLASPPTVQSRLYSPYGAVLLSCL